MRDGRARSSGVIERTVDVIVVEDEDDARDLLSGLLESSGFRVRAFATAEAAFAAAHAQAPDVVVTDLVLRTRLATGWGLAEMLRRDEATAHVALIAVTGKVEPQIDLARPFDACLMKPIDVDLLLNLVAQLARASREKSARQMA
jgi:CheY-like chemotaxis protein